MVAATALANVMKQRRQIQQPGLVPAAGQLRAQRVFVRMLGHEKAAHIAQHHQRVLIDCVNVEQVVLHLPDDAAKRPQITPQHRGRIHQAERVGLAVWLLQDLHEGVAVDRVLAEGVVHQVASAVQRSQRACRQIAQAGGFLVRQKGGQNGLRVFLVQVVAGNFDQAVFVKKAVVNAFEGCVVGVQVLLNVQQQDLLQLHDSLGGPVVAAHQHFAGAHGHGLAHRGVALNAKRLGHSGLQVKDQSVFMAARQCVQLGADQAQGGLIALQLGGFKLGGNARGGQLAPAVAQACRLCYPQNGVQIAQTTGGLFAVGLQRIRCAVVLDMALLQLQRFGREKRLGVKAGAKLLAKVCKQGCIAINQARLQQRGLYGHILPGLGHAFADGAHAGANL